MSGLDLIVSPSRLLSSTLCPDSFCTLTQRPSNRISTFCGRRTCFLPLCWYIVPCRRFRHLVIVYSVDAHKVPLLMAGSIAAIWLQYSRRQILCAVALRLTDKVELLDSCKSACGSCRQLCGSAKGRCSWQRIRSHRWMANTRLGVKRLSTSSLEETK